MSLSLIRASASALSTARLKASPVEYLGPSTSFDSLAAAQPRMAASGRYSPRRPVDERPKNIAPRVGNLSGGGARWPSPLLPSQDPVSPLNGVVTSRKAARPQDSGSEPVSARGSARRHVASAVAESQGSVLLKSSRPSRRPSPSSA